MLYSLKFAYSGVYALAKKNLSGALGWSFLTFFVSTAGFTVSSSALASEVLIWGESKWGAGIFSSGLDQDGDGVLDDADNCEKIENADQSDADGDEIGDVCDDDDDGDGVADSLDAFPLNGAESVDTDGDGVGNNADTDDDNDGFRDAEEIEAGTDPLDANSLPEEDAAGLPIWLKVIATDPRYAPSPSTQE